LPTGRTSRKKINFFIKCPIELYLVPNDRSQRAEQLSYITFLLKMLGSGAMSTGKVTETPELQITLPRHLPPKLSISMSYNVSRIVPRTEFSK